LRDRGSRGCRDGNVGADADTPLLAVEQGAADFLAMPPLPVAAIFDRTYASMPVDLADELDEACRLGRNQRHRKTTNNLGCAGIYWPIHCWDIAPTPRCPSSLAVPRSMTS
jgi:hypothetical protein